MRGRNQSVGCRHVTTVQETSEKQQGRTTLAGEMRSNCVGTALQQARLHSHLSRHGLWSGSPQGHAWNTMISSDQPQVLRFTQMLTTVKCEAIDN